jgi:hypothetical protein
MLTCCTGANSNSRKTEAEVAADSTPFEGVWESEKNEMHRWTFSGFSFVEYRELEGENGEHYYKGTFSYRENTAGSGAITLERSHASKTGGAWTPSDEGAVTTGYRFLSATKLNISSKTYNKK